MLTILAWVTIVAVVEFLMLGFAGGEVGIWGAYNVAIAMVVGFIWAVTYLMSH